MVVIKLLTDTKSVKDKVIASVNLTAVVANASKAIGEKTGIARHDVWSVADQKAARVAKDPTTILLKEKLNPKSTFAKQGIAKDDCVYIKKRGAPPNKPAEAKATKAKPPASPEPASEPATPAPAPPPPAPPAPTPPAAPVEPPTKQPPPPPSNEPPAPPPPVPSPTPAAPPAPPVPAPAAPAPVAPPAPVQAPPPAPAVAVAPPAVAAPPTPAPQKPPPTPEQPKMEEKREQPKMEAAPAKEEKEESAVDAFIEEIKGLGMKKREEDGVGGVLGAIMTELSMKPTNEREYYRGRGLERSRSPVAKWAKNNKDNPAARTMLEVAGLIESIENPKQRDASPDLGRGHDSRLDPSSQEVVDFLSRIGLQKYTQSFLSADIDMETLLSLSEPELAEIGVQSLGAKKRIMAEIERMRGRQQEKQLPVHSYNNEQQQQQQQQQLQRRAPSHDWIRGMEFQQQTERQDLEHVLSQMKYEDERALRREKELERKWEEVRLLDRAGNPSEWEALWEDAKAFDYQEICRWKSRVRNEARPHSPPPSARRDLLLQRLSDIKAEERRGRASPPPSNSHIQTYYTAQGVPYYFNTVTNQTTWTRPSPTRRGRSNGRHSRSPTYHREMSPNYYQYPGY